jgi:hypothetical protein
VQVCQECCSLGASQPAASPQTHCCRQPALPLLLLLPLLQHSCRRQHLLLQGLCQLLLLLLLLLLLRLALAGALGCPVALTRVWAAAALGLCMLREPLPQVPARHRHAQIHRHFPYDSVIERLHNKDMTVSAAQSWPHKTMIYIQAYIVT